MKALPFTTKARRGITSLVCLAAVVTHSLAGDLNDTPERLTIVGSPIMGNVAILWSDLLFKEDPKFKCLHDLQPTDSEVFNLRHDHVDAIFLNRKLLERDVNLLEGHPGKVVEVNIGQSVKHDYQVYMYFWEADGRIDPLIEQFLEEAISDAGMAISRGEAIICGFTMPNYGTT